MKTPHLASALAALGFMVLAMSAGQEYAKSVEAPYIHALAPAPPSIALDGVVLSRAAARQSDLLLVYGSSEIQPGKSEYNAARFFAHYPTGFAPFLHAEYGWTALTLSLALAGLGGDARHARVVISLAPGPFYARKVGPDAYAGRFSRIAAYELTFSPDLSESVKQVAARRMLDYPETLRRDPVLAFALVQLAQAQAINRLIYAAIWPLGRLKTQAIELQDHAQVLSYIHDHPSLPAAPPRAPEAIDWAGLEQRARQEQMAQANNNPYGIDNQLWTDQWQGQISPDLPGRNDQRNEEQLAGSQEWGDLDILMRILHDLGARPLLLSRPLNGTFWDAVGVSATARQAYYARLEQIAVRYHVPLVDFRELEMDKYFSNDPSGHPSRVGWLYIDRVLDAYYHDSLEAVHPGATK